MSASVGVGVGESAGVGDGRERGRGRGRERGVGESESAKPRFRDKVDDVKPVERCCAASLVALGVALALGACGNAFSSNASAADGGTDAGVDTSIDSSPDVGTADGRPSDGPGTVDGSGDAASDVVVVMLDAGDGGGPCVGAFSAPTLVLAHTAQYWVDSITLTEDELDAFVTLYPVGSTTEQRKVYAMHRASASVPFTMDTSQQLDLTNVGPTPGAFDVALSPDDLTLYFSHRQDSDAGGLGVNIYEAQRGDAGGTFSASTEFGPAIDDPATNQFHAHPGGPNLYFTVAPVVSAAQGQRDLYVAPLAGGARAAITELNGATTQEANPVPSRDELEIFFSSDRANPGGNNLVYHARRNSAALAFSMPTVVAFSLPDAGTNVTPQQLAAQACRVYILVDQQDAYVSQRAAN